MWCQSMTHATHGWWPPVYDKTQSVSDRVGNHKRNKCEVAYRRHRLCVPGRIRATSAERHGNSVTGTWISMLRGATMGIGRPRPLRHYNLSLQQSAVASRMRQGLFVPHHLAAILHSLQCAATTLRHASPG